MENLLKVLLESGPYGVASAAMLVMGYLFHRGRVSDLKSQHDEAKTDKADYKAVITGNTEAMTKMAGSLDNNTVATRELQSYLRGPRP